MKWYSSCFALNSSQRSHFGIQFRIVYSCHLRCAYSILDRFHFQPAFKNTFNFWIWMVICYCVQESSLLNKNFEWHSNLDFWIYQESFVFSRKRVSVHIVFQYWPDFGLCSGFVPDGCKILSTRQAPKIYTAFQWNFSQHHTRSYQDKDLERTSFKG